LRSYVLPSMDGYYIVRIIKVLDTDSLKKIDEFYLEHEKFGERTEQKQAQKSLKTSLKT